jgi:predicted molibdopterin-dependent oxidoreductase YjgC
MSGDNEGLRVPGLGERGWVTFTFAGQALRARAGDTVAMALWALGERALRTSCSEGAPRGVFCNMGVCFECQVLVDGRWARASTTEVREGMAVERGGAP